ncbi:CvfB family protein [Algoriphagus machipongonensis]|uniref:YitL protein n=1 Tax=Algoriphagus machipongonensis TaxID=388413 RepID=A3HSD0_9BACT|nr:S1-like domain-containing RNA-binding protein [Algoriphagus machipongonensis]EAZ82748.2 YitL protein [Algoriphagus machipongonensis]
MKELGVISSLPINRFTDFGAYLALSSGEEVLLPQGYLLGDEKEGEEIAVFVYTDSEDRPVAVTESPKALLDEFAVLEAKEVAPFGVFMDWGLPKDLLVPKSEMGQNMVAGEKYLVKVCVDFQTNRLIGVNKYRDFITEAPEDYVLGTEVSGLVFDHTDLGYKVLIEDKYEGLVFNNEVFQPIEVGELRKFFVKKRRDDGKVDLQLLPPGRMKYEEGADLIMSILEEKSFLPLHDKSAPDEIKNELGMSKKHFKQCIGQLYKAGKIKIMENGISINASN